MVVCKCKKPFLLIKISTIQSFVDISQTIASKPSLIEAKRLFEPNHTACNWPKVHKLGHPFRIVCFLKILYKDTDMATKLYCFVHQVPVCGECICFPEHQICVVKSYSQWVLDGEYDWPPSCSLCKAVIDAGKDPKTTRLGYVIHTNCLSSQIQNYPPGTASAGYTCPACSSPIWPPKSIKDTGSCLHVKLKEVIIQTGLEKNILGSDSVPLPMSELRSPPPAFSSGPLVGVSPEVKDSGVQPLIDASLAQGYSVDASISSERLSLQDIVEIDGPNPIANQFASSHESSFSKSLSPGSGATTRKVAVFSADRQNSESYYLDDHEDGSRKKYTRRGPFHHKFLRFLLPFWSTTLPTLPVTAPPRKDKDGNLVDNITDGRSRHQRSSRMDPRKILLFLALMACMATMVILYYRIAQRNLLEVESEDGQE